MTIIDIIEKGTKELKQNNIEYAKTKARLLIEFVLNKTRQYIIVNDKKELNEEEEKKYFEYIQRIKQGTPLEHITHKKEFMKLEFFVNENVLIPRQDTEILVEEVIQIAQSIKAKKILDLCTGSGAIAISLAKYLPKSEIIASDISDKALEVAKKNAIDNQVNERIEFVKSDMFENLKKQEFDIVVSNPPYIKTDIINELDEEVKKEPYIALDGGETGLKFYKEIIKKSYKYLKSGGYLCLEIGFDQKEEVVQLIENKGEFENIYSKKDLYDNDRIVIARKK